ncbi:RNA-binding protein [Gloeobacter kilaueensis]|uniref:RNA-binding protein n=1 Tax=Gloeobacter kilaueensis (strain ATCC BAA-2537 / CCAP 1431/1 / ULC 316 / JS1) TaxID=1183438 RepID=U5QKK3_GLOK1|nr:RNA-binding protein [Gloeobacter kilaueensis]AGY59383.1 RNA-binding protein [Gloeobacter kilaueensis JS1]
MSVRLYIGNLPEEVTRQELESFFAPVGNVVSLKVITDRKTNKCRGFGFLTVPSPEVADSFIEQFNGATFKDATLRVEKAQPKTKGERSEEGGSAPAESEAAAVSTSEPGSAPEQPQPAPARSTATPLISTGRSPIRKNDKQRQNDSRRRDSNRERPAVTTTSSDEANQPDPRWADALRDIRRQLTAKA